jgi:hypothetical protein
VFVRLNVVALVVGMLRRNVGPATLVGLDHGGGMGVDQKAFVVIGDRGISKFG